MDSSKSEVYGYLLPTVPGLDVRGVHLIRDSRAVAHSHQRRKSDPNLETGHLPTVKPAQVAALWNATNLMLSLRCPGQPTLRLRYEDVVAAPEQTLRRLWQLMDEPTPALDFLAERPMILRPNHTVAGNPDRFQSAVNLRLDNEWRKKMPLAQRRLMTALTFPLLLRFGYLASGETVASSEQTQRPALP